MNSLSRPETNSFKLSWITEELQKKSVQDALRLVLSWRTSANLALLNEGRSS